MEAISGKRVRKYNVYDEDNQFLGVIHGRDESEALDEAKAFGMLAAHHVKAWTTLPTKKDYLN